MKMLDAIKKRRAEMPDIYRANYDTAMDGRSRKAAVKALCLECTGWQRTEITKCTAPACPLHPYRPFKNE